MLIVLQTISSDSHNDEDYDYAVVKLEEDQAMRLASYLSMFRIMKKSEPRLEELTLTDEDVECEFYPCGIWERIHRDDEHEDIMPEKIRKDLDEHGYAVFAEEDYVLPFTPRDAHSPDGTFVIVSEKGFWWHTLPTESCVTVDTQTLPFDILKQLI